MYIKSKRGQSTVEYVLLVTAVIAVLIAFFSGGAGNNGFSNQLNSALNTAVAEIGVEGGVLAGSHAQPAGNAVASNSTLPYTVDVTSGV